MMKKYSDAEIAEMSIRQINKIFRDADESWLYPVCGRFNATERAIRRLKKQQREGMEFSSSLEYWLALDAEIERAVNECI